MEEQIELKLPIQVTADRSNNQPPEIKSFAESIATVRLERGYTLSECAEISGQRSYASRHSEVDQGVTNVTFPDDGSGTILFADALMSLRAEREYSLGEMSKITCHMTRKLIRWTGLDIRQLREGTSQGFTLVMGVLGVNVRGFVPDDPPADLFANVEIRQIGCEGMT